MLDKLIGSLTSAIPSLNASTSATSASQPQGGGGLGSIVDKFVSPIAAVGAAASSAVSGVVDAFMPPIAKNLINDLTGGATPADGSLPSGLKFEVNILKSIVAAKPMDATEKAHIESALDQVKAGKSLDLCLSPLSSQEKTMLADTIGNCGFEPPECLNPYLSNKSQGDSGRMDCALKNVEVYEKSGYSATEASHMLPLIPLAGPLLGH